MSIAEYLYMFSETIKQKFFKKLTLKSKEYLLKDPSTCELIQKFNLSLIDIAWHIKHDIPFCSHYCKICGKVIHISRSSYSKFPEYCSIKCSSRSVDRLKHIKATVYNKYGVFNVFQDKAVKLKIKETVKKNSMLNNDYFESINQKRINTCKKIYGVSNPSKSPLIQQKIKEIIQAKYNVKSSLVLKKTRDNMCQKLRLGAWNTILKRSKPLGILPLFSINTFIGSGYDKFYKWKCLKCGHVFEHYYANGKIPNCPHCKKDYISNPQKEIINFIQSITKTKLIINNKEIIKPYELDIYIPELKVAVEVNGDYWHSNLFKDKDYHLNKTKLCEEKGIRLIHIFESEWIFKKDKIKRLINAVLNKTLLNLVSKSNNIIKLDRKYFLKKDLKDLGYSLEKIIKPKKEKTNKAVVFNCGYLIGKKFCKNFVDTRCISMVNVSY